MCIRDRRINSSRNVGIGTTSPTGKFAVSDGTTEGEINPSGGICYIGTRSNHPVTLLTNATGRMTIDTSGNVGIENTDPKARLHINSHKNAETDRHDASNYHLVLRNPEDDTGQACGLGFSVTSNTTKVGASILHERDGGGSEGSLQFYTSGDGNSVTERMRIASDGKVGIGTASPTQKFHVSGDALIAGAAGGTLLLGGSAAHTSKFVIGDNSGSGNGNLVIEGGDGSDFIKIASNGNVGIKTTSPIGTLDVHDGTFVLSKPSSNSSSRNWRFLPDNIAAGNLGLQVSTAAGGSTFQNVLEVDDDGTIFTAQNGTAFSWGSNPGHVWYADGEARSTTCLLYTSPSPRDRTRSRMPSSA